MLLQCKNSGPAGQSVFVAGRGTPLPGPLTFEKDGDAWRGPKNWITSAEITTRLCG